MSATLWLTFKICQKYIILYIHPFNAGEMWLFYLWFGFWSCPPWKGWETGVHFQRTHASTFVDVADSSSFRWREDAFFLDFLLRIVSPIRFLFFFNPNVIHWIYGVSAWQRSLRSIFSQSQHLKTMLLVSLPCFCRLRHRRSWPWHRASVPLWCHNQLCLCIGGLDGRVGGGGGVERGFCCDHTSPQGGVGVIFWFFVHRFVRRWCRCRLSSCSCLLGCSCFLWSRWLVCNP